MLLILRFLIVFLFFFAPYSHATEIGNPAPDFSLKTLNGEDIRLSDYKGKNPVYIIFWATWCPACKEEIPKLKEIYSQFQSKGLTMLAINVGINDSAKKAALYKEKHNLPYPVLFDNDSLVTKLYNVMGTPTMIVIDKSGIIRYRSSATPDDLDKHFDKLIE
ncbi:MAG: TlpA family protein disulfide reductase [Nitrospinae bacterium]|nr:TlpA family protein disulfide reductase [Nitrospinota bacterium]